MKETPKVRRIPAYVRNPHVMKAAIYVRVSSARVEQLRSLSNQVSAMTRCGQKRIHIGGSSTAFWMTAKRKKSRLLS